VIKVESLGRPDGARRGPSEFFDLLNADKRSVALDLARPAGVATLGGLLQAADVVIEASRPRALEQFGLVAEQLVRDGGPQVWLSITGHGRANGVAHRVAFGDDAAVAGGLVSDEEGQPRFCGDAIADPLSGLTAAGACLDALSAGGRWLLDVSMAAVAADLCGPTIPVVDALEVAPPRARPIRAPARPLGADTDRVLEAFALA
jgi:crotonobetainyl-CoA:carnitine CoA-transferase CaiB-like acyl-CoA transferase